ncbi:MAG: phosphatase domain-containing protein [Verrucomicrobiota bacterium]
MIDIIEGFGAICGMKLIWLAMALASEQAFSASHRSLVVVSDIDDTIKETRVLRSLIRRDGSVIYAKNFRHLAGDPFRTWIPVRGMADRYRTWEAVDSVEFVYLSSSPWFYRRRINRFLHQSGFPLGKLYLNAEFPITPADFKTKILEQMILRGRGQSFVLIGDTGEDDRKVYQRSAERFPSQVKGIFLRDVTPMRKACQPSKASSLRTALPAVLFTEGNSLPASLRAH